MGLSLTTTSTTTGRAWCGAGKLVRASLRERCHVITCADAVPLAVDRQAKRELCLHQGSNSADSPPQHVSSGDDFPSSSSPSHAQGHQSTQGAAPHSAVERHVQVGLRAAAAFSFCFDCALSTKPTKSTKFSNASPKLSATSLLSMRRD